MTETLLFDQFTWLIFVVPFLGLLVAGLSKRQDPEIRGDRIYRHDVPARVSHWCHALGTLFLLISGIILGTRFTPAFVEGGNASAVWFNVHFVFALLFLFGTFYWLGNTIISTHRLAEHLPTKKAIKSTINHYGSMLGFKRFTYPREDKYFESERMAFVMAVLVAAAMVLTGLIKVLAHWVNLPDGLMLVVTWTHDICAVLMLLFLLAHVFFAVVIPAAWKTFPSMIFGYMPLDHAREEHAAWVDELEKKEGARGASVTGGASADRNGAGTAAEEAPAQSNA